MSKQSTIEDCGVGPKPRGSQRNRTTTTNVLAADAANNIAEAQQADLAAVLSELQALRTTVTSINTKISAVDDFGNKLDNVEKRITEMNGSVAAVQRSFADLKADIIANDKRLTEAEDRIGTAEDDIERVKLELTDAVKRIAYLESKTEDLENRWRRKNLRLVGLPESAEKTRPMVEFIQHMLPIWLGLDTSRTFVLERAHRTLAKPRPGQSRAYIHGGDLEYTYDPGGLHMEKHWGVQPQVEYFNPRGGKVACRGKDTCSRRLTVETHMWGSPRGGTMHMEAPSQARKLPVATLALTSSVLEETQGLLGSPEEYIARIPSVERNGEQAKTPEQNLLPAS
ncbi:hypothetical protein PO909_032408 [Leuciscus waleckii]